MNEHEESARRIREALLESGLSQQELADRSGVCKASISQYMNGTHTPGNKKAGALGKVLHVRAQWLMCLDNKKKEPINADAIGFKCAQDALRRMASFWEYLSESDIEEIEHLVEYKAEKNKQSKVIKVYNPNIGGDKNGK